MFTVGLTDHVEGPADRPSSAIFDEVAELVQLADRLGVGHAWFSEHHAHAHLGHMPTPLLFALHLAGQTRNIQLGTAILCLNLRNPVDIAEQVAVADTLTGGRIAVGFGSGSTPGEFALFGFDVTDDQERHSRFESALNVIQGIWSGGSTPRLLPSASPDLAGRSWLAVNSPASAQIAGKLGFNVLFSHLRTPEQYRRYREAYLDAGGSGLVAANRPVFVGPDDATAFELAERALRVLWRRFQKEGKIPASTPEPTSIEDLAAHPINFIIGGADTVARQLVELHDQVPFDVANVEVRWAGLSHDLVLDSLRRLMEDVMPRVASIAERFATRSL